MKRRSNGRKGLREGKEAPRYGHKDDREEPRET